MTGQVAASPPQALVSNSVKTIYFVRHAESLENHRHKSMHRVIANLKAASMPDPDDVMESMELLDIPSHVDTPVTPRGKRQIENVAQQLQQNDFVPASQISLVVHSPLQRAQETAEGLLDCRNGQCVAPTVQRVVQLDVLRERTPDEIWIPWRRAQYNARKQAFLLWIMEQPETVIAVVGHSEYFKSLLHLPFKFGHCDVWRAEFRPWTRKKWFGLERLYWPQLKGGVTTTTELEDELKSSTDEEFESESVTAEESESMTAHEEVPVEIGTTSEDEGHGSES